MNTYNSTNHLPFVASVFVRPAMYTVSGTLAETFCFLHGFFDGKTQHSRDPRVLDAAHRHWYGFLTWLQPQLDPSVSDDWSHIYAALHQQYPSDADALTYLRTAYQTYWGIHHANAPSNVSRSAPRE